MGNTQNGGDRGEFQALVEPLHDEEGGDGKTSRPRRRLIDSLSDYDNSLDSSTWDSVGFASGTPVEMFFEFFEYLTHRDLIRAAQVCRSWRQIAYDPAFWRTLDLSNLYYKADDALLYAILQDSRFTQLTKLSLNGCTALSDHSLSLLAQRGALIEELYLNRCPQLDATAILTLVRHLPQLRSIELWGVTHDYLFAEDLKLVRPGLDLGLFGRVYLTSKQLDWSDSKTEVTACRHEHRFHVDQRACWGPIKGRLAYSSNFYHYPGNYPSEPLYSCQIHREDDFADDLFQACQYCDRLFRPDSMYSEHVCRVCYDWANLLRAGNWTELNDETLKNFSFADVIGKTLHIADCKNLPLTLRRKASVPFVIDFTSLDSKTELMEELKELKNEQDSSSAAADAKSNLLADDNFWSEEHGGVELKGLDEDGKHDDNTVDPEAPLLGDERDVGDAKHSSDDDVKVPVSRFLQNNGELIRTQMSVLKEVLQRASDGGYNRALLVYNETEDNNIDVYCDQRAVMGARGEEHLKLMNEAWRQLQSILAPILFTMIAVVYFMGVFERQLDALSTPAVTDYLYFVKGAEEPVSLPLDWIILGAIVIVLLPISAYVMWRHRELCITVLRKLFCVDFFLIYLLGGATLLFSFLWDVGIQMDFISFLLLSLNLAVVASWSLYCSVPPAVHRVCLVYLNIIMAVMLAVALPWYILYAMLFLVAAADLVVAFYNLNHEFTPFIVPTRFQLLYETPRILYHVGGLRMRTLDMMLYGLMAALLEHTIGSVVGGILSIMAGLSLIVFVIPYFGKDRLRPLPVALLFVSIFCLLGETNIIPFTFPFAPALTENPVHSN